MRAKKSLFQEVSSIFRPSPRTLGGNHFSCRDTSKIPRTFVVAFGVSICNPYSCNVVLGVPSQKKKTLTRPQVKNGGWFFSKLFLKYVHSPEPSSSSPTMPSPLPRLGTNNETLRSISAVIGRGHSALDTLKTKCNLQPQLWPGSAAIPQCCLVRSRYLHWASFRSNRLIFDGCPNFMLATWIWESDGSFAWNEAVRAQSHNLVF